MELAPLQLAPWLRTGHSCDSEVWTDKVEYSIESSKHRHDQNKEFHMSASIAVSNVLETTIEDIHSAYKSGQLTARQLVQTYLDRIAAYDKQGPAINAIITTNPSALAEADRLDAAFKASGFVGPLHGIPIIIKDQADAKGMPTTLGPVLFKNYYPDRHAVGGTT